MQCCCQSKPFRIQFQQQQLLCQVLRYIYMLEQQDLFTISIFLSMFGKTNPEDILTFGNQNNRASPSRPPTKQEIQAKKEEQKLVDQGRTGTIKHHREVIQQRKKNIAQGKTSQNTTTPQKSGQLFYDPFLKDKSPYSRTKIPQPKAISEVNNTPAKPENKVQQKKNVETSSKKNLKQSAQNNKDQIQDDAKSNKTGKLQRTNKIAQAQAQKQKTETNRSQKSPQLIDEIFKPNVDKSIYKLRRTVQTPKAVQQTSSQKNMASSFSIAAQSSKKQVVEKYTTPQKVEPKKPTQVKTENSKVSPRQQLSSTKNVDQKTPIQKKENNITKPATNPYQITKRPPINQTANSTKDIVKQNTLSNSKSQVAVKIEQNKSKPATSTQKYKKSPTNKTDNSKSINNKNQDSFSKNSNQVKNKHCSVEQSRQNNAQNNLNQSVQKKQTEKRVSNSKPIVNQQENPKTNNYGRDKYYANNNKQESVDSKGPTEKNKANNLKEDESLNQLKKRIEELMKQNEIYVSQTNRLQAQLEKQKRAKHSQFSTKQIIEKQGQIKEQVNESDILRRYFELQDAYQASRMQLQLARNDIIRKKAMIEIANLQIIQRNRLIMELRYDQEARTPMMMEKLSLWTLEEGLHSYSRDPVGQIIKQRRRLNKQDCVNFRATVIQQMGKASRMSYQSPSIQRQRQMNALNFRSEKHLKISKRDLFNSGQRTVMNSGQRYQELQSVAEDNGKLQKLQLRLRLLKRQNEFLKHRARMVEE